MYLNSSQGYFNPRKLAKCPQRNNLASMMERTVVLFDGGDCCQKSKYKTKAVKVPTLLSFFNNQK